MEGVANRSPYQSVCWVWDAGLSIRGRADRLEPAAAVFHVVVPRNDTCRPRPVQHERVHPPLLGGRYPCFAPTGERERASEPTGGAPGSGGQHTLKDQGSGAVVGASEFEVLSKCRLVNSVLRSSPSPKPWLVDGPGVALVTISEERLLTRVGDAGLGIGCARHRLQWGLECIDNRDHLNSWVGLSVGLGWLGC